MNDKEKAYVSIALAAVNTIVFFVLSLNGITEDAKYLLEHGALYAPYVVEQGQYYRLLTSMFLHFGFEHLLNNMVMLLVVGWSLEPVIGRIKFFLVYLGSGLISGIVYTDWCLYFGDCAVSVGASGAIFGLVGALLYVVKRNRNQPGTISLKRMRFMIVLMLYYGFTNAETNNVAHVSGLVSGFLLAVLLVRIRNGNIRKKDECYER